MQDKQAEINLTEREIEEGAYLGSDLRDKARRKNLQLLQAILSDNQLVLDAGCGPGNYAISLAEKNEIAGIDISSKVVGMAKERANKKNAMFHPFVGDLERLPFRDNSFDVCLCIYTLHHLPDIYGAVSELVRVAKTEGRIAILDVNGSNPGVRLSNIMENLIRRHLVKRWLDTPNETIHGHRYYINTLDQLGIIDIRSEYHCVGGMPPLPRKSKKQDVGLSIIYFIVHLRRLVYILMAKLFPDPIGGSSLLITGTKKYDIAPNNLSIKHAKNSH